MTIKQILTHLVNPSRLKNLLAQQGFLQNYRIIEASVGSTAYDDFNNKGHIPKAVYVDILRCTQPTKYIPRNVPNFHCFQDYIGSLGISNKHQLIIYDRSPYGFFASSRLWWTFRLFGHENVTVLDGGLNGWVKEGFELTKENSDFKEESFVISGESKELIRNFEQIVENIESKGEQVVDSRPSPDFQRVDPFTGLENHIPDSLNVPYGNLFDEKTGRLKTEKELLKLFRCNLVDLSKPFVVSCNTGMTASSLAFAAQVIGVKDVPVYVGSWTEFSQKRPATSNSTRRVIK